MLFTVINKKTIRLVPAFAVIMRVTIQSAFTQPLAKRSGDTVKTAVNDSLLPALVLNAASYTSAIDYTDFIKGRKVWVLSFRCLKAPPWSS